MLAARIIDGAHRIANIRTCTDGNHHIAAVDPAQLIAKCTRPAIDQNHIVAKQPIGIGKLIGRRIGRTAPDDKNLPRIFNRDTGVDGTPPQFRPKRLVDVIDFGACDAFEQMLITIHILRDILGFTRPVGITCRKIKQTVLIMIAKLLPGIDTNGRHQARDRAGRNIGGPRKSPH